MVWEPQKAKEVFEILKKEYKINSEEFVSLWVYEKFKDPFKVLIATILSQSSTDKSALISFNKLEERIGIEPEKIEEANLEDIECSIKFSGLQRQKAKAIKEIAKRLKIINLREILEEDIESARKKLLELPKVGPKTADVLLALFKKEVVPVDTHVERVSKRLGIVDMNAKYEEIKKKLEELFQGESRHMIHLLFISHGRKICKSRKPLCFQCKIFEYCEYPLKDKYLA